jgi:hypothetical protein
LDALVDLARFVSQGNDESGCGITYNMRYRRLVTQEQVIQAHTKHGLLGCTSSFSR